MNLNKNNLIFSRKDVLFFGVAGILIAAGYLCMIFDPVPNGFGPLTLWLAPPLLLLGFVLVIPGIVGTAALAAYFSLSRLKTNLLKHIGGVVVLLISFVTYLLTLEPTASLWDCSEFIASAYKLQVPHTPGTPLSLLFGRLFTMFSFGDVSRVAWCINLMSGFFSSLTVYLIYHIIYFFGEAITPSPDKKHTGFLVFASLCGSLCLTFSDSFWFSAVEAETYGAACFFMVLTVWLILKGKDLTGSSRSRQLILIFYMLGLSYCVHPMCLLVIALLPFAWYTSNRTLTIKNFILCFIVGTVIIFVISRFVAVGVFELFFAFDLFFVNSLHLPFNSGAIVLIILFIALFIFLLKKYRQHESYTWSVVFLLIGFVPYLLLLIRSQHNPPIDENNPENLPMLKAYMNRESYPSSPILYGPYFDAQIDNVSSRKTVYYKSDDRYEVAGDISDYHYEDSRQTLLPRLHSHDPDHIETYRAWTGLKPNEKPRFIHSMTFLFNYQLGYMYFRYFLWNFAGREGDVQGSAWLKPWESANISGDYTRARNQYWMIPLLIGIAGVFYQYKRDRKNFLTNTIFFLITGIVLVLYLNSPPSEPRERDYIYVGSYIAFCVWVGLGILALQSMLTRVRYAPLATGMISLGIPLWMLIQNLDDHDRSGRTFQIDNARNILNSCAPGAILFTGGDNDTFPLWYLQEVEGFRTDVRVTVLSYFNTDWYINQLRKQYYDSEPFRLTLDPKDYRQYGLNDVLYVTDNIREGIDARKYIQLLKEEHPALTMASDLGDPYHILPSRKLNIKVDSDQVLRVKNIPLHSSQEVTPTLTFEVTKNYLEKNGLAVLDLIISNHWERPIYFNFTSMNSLSIEIKPYLVQEGLVYRLLPVNSDGKDMIIDKETSYRNLITNADYTNLRNEDANFNFEDYQARMISPVRQSLNSLAEAYLKEGDRKKAEEILLYAVDNLYMKHLMPSFSNLHTASLLRYLEKNDLAKELTLAVFDYHSAQIRNSLQAGKNPDPIDRYLLTQSAELLDELGEGEYTKKITDLQSLM